MQQLTPEQAIEIALRHHRAGNLREAETIYRQVLQALPEHPSALHWLGVIARQTGHPEDEMTLLRRSIELNPSDAAAQQDMGEAYSLRGMFAEAEVHYRAAAALSPVSPAILNDLSVVCHKQRRYAEALELVDRAIRLGPEIPQAYGNRGMTLTDLGRLDEAIEAFDESLRLRPDHTPTLLSKARALFLKGELKEAFALYETRLRTPDIAYPKFAEPLWDGRDPAGQTILVVAEQGVGDTIQFARYLPLLAARGAKVILLCLPATKPLFETIPGIRVVGSGEPRVQFDVHVPILSLPRIFETALQTIPADVPYLAADPQRVTRWRERVDKLARLKVGLVWAGSPKHTSDRLRSMRLADFATPLAGIADVAWFSLQKGEAAAQLTADVPRGVTIDDLAPDVNDYAATAALISALDLLITVDTSVAHLAGALARPVWTVLPYESEWRWMRDRGDSPWYRTMRLFRQPTPGEWATPLAEIARELVTFGRDAAST